MSLVSFSVQANPEVLANLLTSTEVKNLSDDLAGKSFHLSLVKDIYATKGVRPRCPCESLELTFVKFNPNKTTKYSVTSHGFGPNLNIQVSKIK